MTSSNGGEAKKIQGGWQFDIPSQSRPADGKLKLFASEKNTFLAGNSTLVLDKDYFPVEGGIENHVRWLAEAQGR